MLRLTRPLPQVMDGQQLVVVDVEGNGQREPEIVEIAALPISGTAPVPSTDLRTWLVRPQQPITPIVMRKVHGISNDDVAGCPSWQDVAADVTETLGDRVLVAHNASVERSILATHLPAWKPVLVLDTMKLARTLWPGLVGYGLERLAAHAEIALPPQPAGQRPHRAGYDALLTAELLVALVVHADRDGHDWAEIVAAAGGAPPQEEGLW
ncbi:3'-5' exonuclease [Pseudonocardia sp. MH-G8]|uniref:3'-5' exonuclease n=1 Tax=Pseudonocardia sp. MH-G8 TaxID=1854588 RepID=UPI0013045D4F|nr:3'-5' exonuclease [Pseudonocardia sp. MH-G8]